MKEIVFFLATSNGPQRCLLIKQRSTIIVQVQLTFHVNAIAMSQV